MDQERRARAVQARRAGRRQKRMRVASPTVTSARPDRAGVEDGTHADALRSDVDHGHRPHAAAEATAAAHAGAPGLGGVAVGATAEAEAAAVEDLRQGNDCAVADLLRAANGRLGTGSGVESRESVARSRSRSSRRWRRASGLGARSCVIASRLCAPVPCVLCPDGVQKMSHVASASPNAFLRRA